MIEIRQTPAGGNLKAFLGVVDSIYASDKSYVRSLDFDLSERLHPKKNPFFEHGDATLFTAHRNGQCVGRISASVDHEHLDRHKDATGFFGFLDTVEDQEVVTMLLRAAEDWLRGRGMKTVRGPFSLSINEEIGCLVEGFDSSPMIMMPHHRPYQGGLIEGAGYTKAKDVFAWKYVVGALNTRTKRAHQEVQAMPEVTCRTLSPKDLDRDVTLVTDIFNDAWAENWSFVPFTRNEVRKMAKDFKLILEPELTRIAFIDGEPAAVAVALPNINELIPDLNGKLLPLGFAKLLYRLKVQGPKTARLVILGIRKKFRFNRKYAPLSVFLFGELHESGKRIGIQWGELGWTLEDNGPVNAAIRVMGGEVYKKYRVYERSLAV
ncbi:MAG: hypothetical protein IPG50_09380 [Myxococcales bacterium]|nr:hypothetical protein [Myxococcales bacterium]